MNSRKILFTSVLVSMFIVFIPMRVLASEVRTQHQTEIGIQILNGDYPPEPNPPSHIIHKNEIHQPSYLPSTGEKKSSFLILFSGFFLLAMAEIIYIIRYLKERWLC